MLPVCLESMMFTHRYNSVPESNPDPALKTSLPDYTMWDCIFPLDLNSGPELVMALYFNTTFIRKNYSNVPE
jgi:hypothetical protein